MKVLIISTEKLPVPPIRGGAIQTYIAGSLPSLSKKYDITILGITDPSLPERETMDGIKYVRVPGKLLEIYREGIVNYLKNETFDLIHIFNRPRLVIPVREVCPTSRLVLSMHNDMFKQEKIEPEEAKKAIAQLDKIITISNYIGKTISDLYPESATKLQTIYSGVDLDRFVPSYTEKGKRMRELIRREHGLDGKKVILFAGRLSANKGADVLVRAIPELGKKHSNLALVIVGSKWFSQNDVTDYVAYVRALAERTTVPVITTGFVAPDQIQNWFAAADVFVCPSQWQEPLARVHYEAMAAGLPIVTTARGGNPEVIEVNKNGYVVENPENAEEFVNYISTLLSNSSLCKEMGQYGRKLAEQKFNWNRVVSDISSVWIEMEQKIKNNIPIGIDQLDTVNELVIVQEIAPSELDIQVSLENEIVSVEEVEEMVEVEETLPLKKVYKNENNPPAKPWLNIYKALPQT
jgi:spore coat protein SA